MAFSQNSSNGIFACKRISLEIFNVHKLSDTRLFRKPSKTFKENIGEITDIYEFVRTFSNSIIDIKGQNLIVRC